MSARAAHQERDDEDLAEDEAAFEAVMRGEYVTHEAVKLWLASKDTATPLPHPKAGHFG